MMRTVARELDGVGQRPQVAPIRVMSPASTATSVPVPRRCPRSARASAGASLTPSPTMATRAASPPAAALDLGRLPVGQHPGHDACRSRPRGPRAAAVALVAGEQHHVEAHPPEPAHRLGRRRRRVGDRQDARRAPSTAAADASRPASASARRPRQRRGSTPFPPAQTALPTAHRTPSDAGARPAPATSGSRRPAGPLRAPRARPRTTRRGRGCSERRSTAAARPEAPVVGRRRRNHLGHRGPPRSPSRSCRATRSERSAPLQRLAAPDEHAQLGPSAGAPP